MTALPHKRIGDAVWERDGGNIKLLVESGLDIRKQPIGVPYGSIARTRSREVELGASMNAWLTAMGIPIGGKTYQIAREQSRRISRCRLTVFRMTGRLLGMRVRSFMMCVP
jgi:Plasmid encoded RepA protein